MTIFGLKKKDEKSANPFAKEQARNPFENDKEGDLLGKEEEVGTDFMKEKPPSPMPSVNVKAEFNPFASDVPKFEEELANIKVQLKSITMQLNSIIRSIESLEKK